MNLAHVTSTNSPDFDAWEAQLKEEARKSVHARWALVDRLVDGKLKFDAVLFYAAVKAIGLSKGSANNLVSIGRKWPISRRRENLLPAVHDEFRKLEEGLVPAILERAEDQKWTREECRMRMKAFKAGDVRALEIDWVPPSLRKKSDPDAEQAEEGADTEDKAVFDGTAMGEAVSDERQEVLAAYAEQQFTSGNDFFEKIAATIERKGDPRRFTRELDLRRLNPKRARSLAAFFLEIAAEAEKAQAGALATSTPSVVDPDILKASRALVIETRNASVSHLQRRMQINFSSAVAIIEALEAEGVVSASDFVGRRQVLIQNSAAVDDVADSAEGEEGTVSPASPDLSTVSLATRPGDRERLGHANASGDEVPAGDAAPSGVSIMTGQSSHLAEEFTQASGSSASAGSAVRSADEEPDLPNFLRRGDPACPVKEPHAEAPGADA